MTTATREKPIIFSAAMVRAIMEGRKTQTRRLCPEHGCRGCNHPGNIFTHWNDHGRCSRCDGTRHEPPDTSRYLVGDVLWVRETLRLGCDGVWVYAADGEDVDAPEHEEEMRDWFRVGGKSTRSSIHMDRWAARLFLKVTAVRVQRLQEISEEDAKASGGFSGVGMDSMAIECDRCQGCMCFADLFGVLWNEIHGPGAWALNSWVWAYTFAKIERPA